MKLLVIGQSVVDKINSPKNKITQAGGIFYSILALNAVKTSNDEVTLVSSVSKKNYKYFEDEYDKINKKYLNWSDLIPTVTLNIYNNKERDEQYDSINSSLYVKNNVLNKYDGILLNMITGYDVSVEQLKRMRQNYKGVIYFDVHSLARKIGKEMKREFRVIKNFSEWAENVDIIQANETEFSCLSEKENDADIARSILSLGVKYLIKTMGDKGTRVYLKDRNEIKSIFYSADKINEGTAVGCGDVFGGVFFYNYIKKETLNNILIRTNKASSFAASCNDAGEIKRLGNDL